MRELAGLRRAHGSVALCFSHPFFGPHDWDSPQGLDTLATSFLAGATGTQWGNMERGVCAPPRTASCCPLSRGPRAGPSRIPRECGSTPSSWWPQSWKEEVGRSARAWGNPNGLQVSGYKRGWPAGEPEPCPTMTPSHRPSSPALASVLLAVLLAGEWGHVSACPPVHMLLTLGNVHPQHQPNALLAQTGRSRQDLGRTRVG